MPKSGATAYMPIRLDVDLALINDAIITFAKGRGYGEEIIFQRHYPADTQTIDGVIYLPLTQEDTAELRQKSGQSCRVEAQLNFINGAVAKTEIKNLSLAETLATKFIEGSRPDIAMPDVIYDFQTGAYIIIRGEKGDRGNGIVRAEQIESSDVSQGVNVWRAVFDDGGTSEFRVKNGEKGEKGDTGDVYMPTLYIDLETGDLIMRKPSEDFDRVSFALKNNVDLVVIF